MKNTTRSTTIQALLERGARVFSCNEAKAARYGQGCAPWQGGWEQEPLATVVEADLPALWPESLGLTVVDVDAEDPDEAQALLMYVIERLGIPLVAVPTDGKGGWHVYYRRPEGIDTSNGDWATSDGVPGGQIRGSNGYVVLWDAAMLLDALADEGAGEVDAGEWTAFRAPVAAPGGDSAPRRGTAHVGAYGAHPAMLRAIHVAVGGGHPFDAGTCAGWLVEHGTNERTPEVARREVVRMVKGSEILWARAAVHGAGHLPPGLPATPPAFQPPVADDVALPFSVKDVVRENAPGPKGGHAHKQPTDSLMLAEDYVARRNPSERFVKVSEDNRWMMWARGHGWVDDHKGASILAEMQRYGRQRYFSLHQASGKLHQDKIAGGRQPLAAQAVKVLPSLAGMSVSVARLDARPHLLGLPQGRVLDLSTGTQRDVAPGDLVRKRAAALPVPWRGRVIDRLVHAMLGTDGLAEALQRILGHFLWGAPLLHVIVFLCGVTRGGKTSLLKLLAAALGDYATTMKSDTLTTRATGDGGFTVDNANALLRGVRLAVMSEIPRRRKLDPARINELTGGDDLVSRRIGGDLVPTPATHSIVFGMNDLPAIDVTDAEETVLALFQRLRIFEIRQALDPGLGAQCAAALSDAQELGAVIQWLVEGGSSRGEADFKVGSCPLHPRLTAAALAYWNRVWEGHSR